MADDCCEKCGKALEVADWPFCPHGRGAWAAHADEVPGGFWAENGFDEPRKFYSKKEHLRALAAEGCEVRAKWAGPLDRHLRRWDVPSQYTLEAAAALVSRGRSRPTPVPEPEPAEPITATALDETFRVRAT